MAGLDRLSQENSGAITALERLTCRARACAPNHTLFLEGGTCDHVCFLLEGSRVVIGCLPTDHGRSSAISFQARCSFLNLERQRPV